LRERQRHPAGIGADRPLERDRARIVPIISGVLRGHGSPRAHDAVVPILSRARFHRVLAASLGALVAITLTACAAPAPAAPAAPPPAVVLKHADQQYGPARVVDDTRTASLAIVPAERNGALVVFLHGWSQTRYSILERPEEVSVARTLTAKGYVVAAADAHDKAWGDAAAVADYRALISRTTKRYGLHDVFLMGESMGGLATMQVAQLVPAVRAVVAWYPVCDLRTIHEARFQASIKAAWKGRTRAPVSPVSVGAKPMLVWASAGDTVVTARTNAAVCVAEAHAAGAPVTYFHTSGNHGDKSNFDPKAVLAFFDGHRTPGA
jgi:dienelactone hydrolase